MIFDPLTAASLLVLAAGTQNLCAVTKPTEIKVLPSTKEITFDYSQSLQDLQKYQIDTVDPHSFNGVTMTQGFMQGAIKLVPQVKLSYKVLPGMNAGCIWYEKVTIRMEIDPSIVIAKEVKADRCMNQAVTNHEMKHIDTDRKLVNKYSQIMGQKVYAALQERGFVAGPLNVQDMQSVADRMQKTVYQIVEHEYKKLDLDREEQQRAIDNITEYKRVSAECPDFNPVAMQRKTRSAYRNSR